MAKIPTSWVTNPNKNVNVTEYSDSTVLYSSATQDYVSATVGLNEQNKPATLWSSSPAFDAILDEMSELIMDEMGNPINDEMYISQLKFTTQWLVNPNYATNQYVYDSATNAYDSAIQTYDGVNSGQSSVS